MKYAVTDRSDLGNGSDNAVFGGNKSVKNYFYSLGMRGHLINYPVLLPVGIFHRENSVRDTFVPALRLLDYSINTTDEDELNEALSMLCDQKDLVYSYLVDSSADEMIAGNAAMALIYSGEAAYAQDYNDDLDYVVPKEGSNMWMDSWFIPKTCQHKDAAEQFLNYLCREDIGMENFDYVWYATPNTAVYDELDEEVQESTTIFSDQETLEDCEIFNSLDVPATETYDYLWKKLKSY